MCKSISIKSAVPKSAVDGTKSAVEGRKKSPTLFFLVLWHENRLQLVAIAKTFQVLNLNFFLFLLCQK